MPLMICLVISTAVLWYYRTKNPVKQFRPHWGEIMVLAVVLFGISVTASFFIYRAIETGADSIATMKENAKDAENDKLRPASSDGKSGMSNGGSVFEETLSTIGRERSEAAEQERRGE